MAKFLLTNKAVKDLSNIWNYTLNHWSEKQADKYYNMLIDNCKLIVDRPNIGKKYDNILNQLLGHKIGRHIIFYKIQNNKDILIIRFLHEQMDLKNKIKK